MKYPWIVLRKKPSRTLAIALAVAAVVLLASFGCDSRSALTKKRIRAVEKGLTSSVYLKGLAPQKFSLAERMAFYRVPGVSLAVIDQNAIEWVQAYGEKDDQTRGPLTVESVFQGGAFGQMITGALAASLAEKGLLSLDEDIRPFLKSWRFPPEFEPVEGGLTARLLLAHAADLSDQELLGYSPDEEIPTLVQVLGGVKPASNGPLWFQPRRSTAVRTRYSEAGYAFFEHYLVDRTGTAFEALVKEHVLTPARMAGTTFASPLPEDFRSRAAVGHLREGRPVAGLWKTYPAKAAKGVWTTPSNFASFALDLLKSAGGDGGRVLSPNAARGMLTSQVESYGLGFLIDGSRDDLHFKIRGKTQGYAAVMILYPVRGQGAVIMTNSDNGFTLIDEILCALSQAYEWPHYGPEEKTVLRLDGETYRSFAGTYEVRPDYLLDVKWEDYYLVIQPSGQAATRFYAEGQTLFYSTDPYIRIQFLRDREKVDGLVLWQQDFELQATKIR